MDLVSPSSSWRRLPPNTLDGARCDHAERMPARHRAHHSMGVCLAGSCRALGCDLVIGSGRAVDRCGVCGGRGDSCPHTQHRWVSASAANRSIGEVVQSRRRPLLGPSPG